MILMNDFKAEPNELRDRMHKAARKVIDSGWYVLGNEVQLFEQQWASFCGVSSAVGVGNGMDAIEIALRSLEIGPGDEVITSSMTAFATVLAVIRSGATPVLADIDAETALLSVESAFRCLTSRTKAVLLVHLYGQVRAMKKWNDFCGKNNIVLLEDCAQAHMARLGGKTAGGFGVAGAYSFYPTKNLGATGDGGALITQDKDLAKVAEQMRNYGQSIRNQHPIIGLNSRLDEIQAAILLERLKGLPEFTKRRRQIARAYCDGIKNPLVQHLALPEEKEAHVYHLYVIISKVRDALQEYFTQNQIQTFVHYPIPIHQQIPCINMAHDPNGLYASEKHASTCLSIPCHPQMSDEEVEAVINVANTFKLD